MSEAKLIEWITRWFADQGWAIEAEQGGIVAVMASGYGSGPAVVSISDLAHVISKREEDEP